MAINSTAIETKLLSEVDKANEVQSLTFAEKNNFPIEDVVGTLKALQAKNYLCAKQQNRNSIILSNEALNIIDKGSPEFLLYSSLPAKKGDGFSRKHLETILGKEVVRFGLPQCLKRKQVKICKRSVEDGGDLIVKFQDSFTNGMDTDNSVKDSKEIFDEVRVQLEQLKIKLDENREDFDFGVESKKKYIKELKQRKLIRFCTRSIFFITKGPEFCCDIQKAKQCDPILTSQMIKDGSQKTRSFKPYNFNALGQKSNYGCLHPLMKVRQEFVSIFLQMGFEEMASNNYVESSFQNFDALFQPQQHPARDAHDTFFISNPSEAPISKQDYAALVKKTHENGGETGSLGWRYNWSYDEARKNIMRTHTTSNSARLLYKLGQQKTFTPKKYFSIDRVFRNETLDATHLAEFHQIEGFIADRNLSLGDLIGIIAEFFRKIGIPDVKFKPAYNPYTEPSMEIFGYSPELKKWIEVGNSGIFRPEMLIPMNLPDDVRVIAQGLSLERPTMIKYGISNIRDLFGHKIDLNMVRKNPLARFW